MAASLDRCSSIFEYEKLGFSVAALGRERLAIGQHATSGRGIQAKFNGQVAPQRKMEVAVTARQRIEAGVAIVQIRGRGGLRGETQDHVIAGQMNVVPFAAASIAGNTR